MDAETERILEVIHIFGLPLTPPLPTPTPPTLSLITYTTTLWTLSCCLPANSTPLIPNSWTNTKCMLYHKLCLIKKKHTHKTHTKNEHTHTYTHTHKHMQTGIILHTYEWSGGGPTGKERNKNTIKKNNNTVSIKIQKILLTIVNDWRSRWMNGWCRH
jgi:hypothetical protein